jgi:ATP-binding cassette subfamily C (CFTR/MRP) protein 1
LTHKVEAGQTLVICGRTGSGKSTTILTLLRLLDIQNGVIKVDGIDISRVPRTLIRQRCFLAVPQDPLILAEATLRFNLDPSELASQDLFIKALETTRLLQHFGATIQTSAEVLSMPLSSLPALSGGQFQLFALARALIQHWTRASGVLGLARSRSKPILLLDEATSSLDPQTEEFIHDVVQEEFVEKGHTVIIVAHRLSIVARTLRPEIDEIATFENGWLTHISSVDDILRDDFMIGDALSTQDDSRTVSLTGDDLTMEDNPEYSLLDEISSTEGES